MPQKKARAVIPFCKCASMKQWDKFLKLAVCRGKDKMGEFVKI